ncbi:uncharacterized protein LOC105390159 [Plutella xylostella]|uniref:uncharacterized protein LOC105390159 n=1 Tax=Plutella xylostella TaxID=51655 RepID=UPI002032C4E9|nr:uncharacterized protein LOC105390159 [Plutella xylostella]
MTESDGEIEYLDEDADIVEKCIQTALPVVPEVVLKPALEKLTSIPDATAKPLLVERSSKKKRVYDNAGSDYDPSEDLRPAKRPNRSRQSLNKSGGNKSLQATTPKAQQPKQATSISEPNAIEPKDIESRRKLDIKIPDYEDPLCLPVKLVKHDGADVRMLRTWNKLCLDRLKVADEGLSPKSGEAVGSRRSIVLRHVKHSQTGKLELTVWNKTSVENSEGEKNSEVFQAVLPRFREKTVLDFTMPPAKKKQGTKTSSTVLLTKEGDALIAYKPEEAISAVYQLKEAPETEDADASISRRYAHEVAPCRVCAACHQASSRPAKEGGSSKSIPCKVCQRSFVSVYNLLSHTRCHEPREIRRQKRQISSSLAKIVEYHYKCRICQQKFPFIKDLRKHVTKHRATEKFLCEVGNHWTF